MRLTLAYAATFLSLLVPATLTAQETLIIDAHAPTTPFPHFWEKTFGSGRAILSLRDDYRKDLDTVHDATNFESVRFHGIFNDEVGLYDPDRQVKNPGLAAEAIQSDTVYNFSYIDHIYDGLLARHIRPFVELSFMPKKMSSNPDAVHAFWYHPNVAPPKDYKLWDAMITAFAKHLIDRYGIDEVSTWYFEVWNEPNLDFWGGRPNQPTYFELYDHTARALKTVSPSIIVGGPSTAQAAWVPDFLAHTHQANVPVDFVSTHVYGNDTADNVLHTNENVPRDQMVFRSVEKVHNEILKSPYPKIPLIFSEYNASYANEPNVTDTVYMGPWLANTIRQCDGLTQAMSYWSFSDVFEEQGVVRTPFYGGFGVIAEDDIPKPAFNAFAMLHRLGDQRLPIASNPEDALATRTADGALAIALWNYAPPFGEGSTYTPPPTNLGPSKTITLKLKGVSPTAAAELWQLDADHGNVVKAFDAMGRPATPSRQQILELQAAGKLPAPQHLHLTNNALTVTLPPQGLAVLTIQ
ncbi:GH39 family glycosyl hydrolase [Granulicella arctica]|uniref:Xylan 1,4-beta-xylosidase n=1 Tax=Granulicella arctica TaxID=940613 RepID=A0A7Y9PFX1_9BACT|nr:glycosyl hydrolase family 39 [Granulicella arctica]NYF78975.1 xylan 1,4-beta-xylosidase [Granulicella arctica]